jgi:translation initiation factor 1
MDNKIKTLSWDAFASLGNPENADPDPIEESPKSFKIAIKVHYEKKGRGGKEAVIIRGLEQDSSHDLEAICKILKSKIGVGGSAKDGEIILQGNHRERIVLLLTEMGFSNIKKAGG